MTELDSVKFIPIYLERTTRHFRRQSRVWYQEYRRLLLSEQTNLGDGENKGKALSSFCKVLYEIIKK